MAYFNDWIDPPLGGTDLAGYFADWFDTIESVIADTTPPVINLISPTEFGDYSSARTTPVVIEVTDQVPGLRLVSILVSGAGFTGTVVVYYDGSFFSPFTSSTDANISLGKQFSLLPENGWSPGTLEIVVTAVDQDGNLAAETFEWVISQTQVSQADNPGYPFRDSTWRWRRRLNKQKCSVISVAIDDDYTEGPGFTLTALSLEIGRKPGLDRVPWRGGKYTNRSGSGDIDDGT